MTEQRVFRMFVAVGAVLLHLTSVYGQASHEDARRRFESWSRSGARLIEDGPGMKITTLGVDGKRLEIVTESEIPPGPDGAEMGVVVYFELAATGQYVNPVKHRWNPREELYIWLETAVPLQVSIHQNYPDDRPPSKHIYPDPRFPATFSTVLPGAPLRLPVRFRTDDDLRKEIISLVFVRADAENVPIVSAVSAIATATAVSSGGVASATAVVQVPPVNTTGPGGSIRGDLQRALQNQVAAMSKFNDAANQDRVPRLEIIGPDTDVVTSATPDDVQFFAFGPGKQYQFQITLFK